MRRIGAMALLKNPTQSLTLGVGWVPSTMEATLCGRDDEIVAAKQASVLNATSGLEGFPAWRQGKSWKRGRQQLGCKSVTELAEASCSVGRQEGQ